MNNITVLATILGICLGIGIGIATNEANEARIRATHIAWQRFIENLCNIIKKGFKD